ncbi:MAG: efflux RND transporter periplasmic adaptor subunit [Opitutales bacterium]|nr:efflux RND transporter periplasmic adaptor subunit [Opitutales bacterium]
MKNTINNFFLFIAAVVLLTLSTACTDSEKRRDPGYTVIEPTLMDLSTTVSTSGSISPLFNVQVRSEVSGRIEKIHVEAGDQVERGDLLLQLESETFEAEKELAVIRIETSQLRLNRAEREFNRKKRLYENELISEEEFESAETNYLLSRNEFRSAEKDLVAARDRIRQTRITAPFSGTVLRVPVTEGEVVTGASSVSTGDNLVNLADLEQMLISTHVSQGDIDRIDPSREVEVIVDGADRRRSKANIQRISPLATVEDRVRGFTVELILRDPEGRTRPGMTATLHFPIEEVNEAITLPLVAIQVDGLETFVEVLNGAGEIVTQPVQIGINDQDRVEIREGLSPDSQVVLRSAPTRTKR